MQNNQTERCLYTAFPCVNPGKKEMSVYSGHTNFVSLIFPSLSLPFMSFQLPLNGVLVNAGSELCHHVLTSYI